MDLALDIGGSSVKWAVATRSQSNSLEIMEAVPLPDRRFQSLAAVVADIYDRARRQGGEIDRVGISTTGAVDRQGTVLRAGHFEGYEDVSWRELFADWNEGPVQVHVANDGLASTWGEYSTAREANPHPFSHIHVVVGTGVGSGAVYQGQLVRGDAGFAGYIGHIKITDVPTVRCSCGLEGCVETLAAIPAISTAWRTTGGDGDLDSLHMAAAGGDAAAIGVLETAGYWLGRGLACGMNTLNPSLVTVGGGVALLSAELSGNPLMSGAMRGVTDGAHRRVVGAAHVRPGALGNDAGLIGAAALARYGKSGNRGR